MSVNRIRARRALRRVEEVWRGLDALLVFITDFAISLTVGWGLLKLLRLEPLPALHASIGGRGFEAPSDWVTFAACLLLGFAPSASTRMIFRAVAGDVVAGWALALGLGGMVLSALGIVSALSAVADANMSRGFLLGASALAAAAAAAGIWYLRDQIERQQALQGWRKPLTRIGIVVVTASIGAGSLLSAERGDWISATLGAAGLIVLITSCVFVAQKLLGDAHRHIVDYGPSVSGMAVWLLVLGIPGVVLLAQGVSKLQEGAALPALWSWLTLAGVAALGLFVAARSWRRADSLVSAPTVTARRFSESLKILRGDARKNRRRDPLTRACFYLANICRRKVHRLAEWVSDILSLWTEALRVVLSIVDYFLAEVLASAAGAKLRGRWKRYSVLLTWLGGAALMIMLAPHPWSSVGAAVAFGVALAIGRRWTWIEADRERYWAVVDDKPDAATRIRIGFDQDLADEAIVSFLALVFVHTPLFFLALDRQFALFDFSGEGQSTYLDWLNFVGVELANAAPFADWSEIYGVANATGLNPNNDVGRHAVFALRVGMDVLLLATILQVVASMQRSIRQFQQFTDPGDGTSFLDPFEEREALMQARSSHTLVHLMRFYDPQRLRQLLRAPNDRRAALGAAALAGYGLAAPALEGILYPPTEREFKHGLNALGSRLRPELREMALVWLRRRLRVMPNEHTAGGFPLVQKLLASAPGYRASTAEAAVARTELDLMVKHRRIELLVRRAVDAAPTQRESARQELSKLGDKDVQYLFVLIASDDEDMAGAATSALTKIGERADRSAGIVASLLRMLQDEKRVAVLVAAIRTSAKLEIDEAGPILAKLLRHDSSEVRLASIRAIGEIGADVGPAAIKGLRAIVDAIADVRLTTSFEREEALLALLRIRDTEHANFFAALGGFGERGRAGRPR